MADRKIRTEINEVASSYFDQIAESLQTEYEGKASDAEVVNYVFETLLNLEKLIGDPASFIEGVNHGQIMILQLPLHQKFPGERDPDGDDPKQIGDILIRELKKKKAEKNQEDNLY
jgi:hypothetical protein